MANPAYRGRLAPTPTGRLHLGHALTFRTAYERCRERSGILIYRNEDLDPDRCRPEFVKAALEDLRWLGIEFDEGPLNQSERIPSYRNAWSILRERGYLYPCRCSRRDLREAAQAPHDGGGEPIYPGTCRPGAGDGSLDWPPAPGEGEVCWRFRVTDGEEVGFLDGRLGRQAFRAGRDFGDFVVWRRDGIPAYELAVVVDDAAMSVTEVVRGADLLLSTARQCLLYRALGLGEPAFFHTALVGGADGRRLAKRDQAASIGSLRLSGLGPDEVLAMARKNVIMVR
ncbi:MAG: tRNA glutamyl-Q(34) synthetase GluQRS [Opitutaceae bacterium]